MRRALLTLAALAAGCPGGIRHPLAPVTDAALLGDVRVLADRMSAARIEQPALLLEAYLAHFRGQRRSRDQALCHWQQRSGLAGNAAAAKLSLIKPPSATRYQSFVGAVLAPRRCQGRALDDGRASGDLREGVYVFDETRVALSGDTLTVQERYLIRREGDRLTGWYLRRLSRRSGDGRPYQCSRERSYDVLMAFLLEGRAGDRSFRLGETDAFVRPGPCAPRRLPVERCTGTTTGQGILLRCAEQRLLTWAGAVPEQLGATAGVYQRGHTSPTAQGGVEHVTEDWHVAARGVEVFGLSLRSGRHTARAGGRLACSGQERADLRRLVLLRGRLKDGVATLEEAVALHRPHPCDVTPVPLERWRGEANVASVQLTSGARNLVLRRVMGTPSLAMPPDALGELLPAR